MPENDPLIPIFGRTDPARTPRDAPLTEEQLRLRDSITASRPRFPQRRRLWIPALTLPLAVTIITAVVIHSPAPATAYGPAPLQVASADTSTEDAAETLIDLLADAETEADVPGRVYEEWALHISEAGTPQEAVAVQALVHDVSWQPADGTGTVVTTAGTPFYADGSPGIPTDPDVLTPGEVTATTEYETGEFAPAVADPSILAGPRDEALALFGLTASSHAGDLAPLLPAVLTQWQLAPANEAAMLTLMSGLDGLDLVGTTTDRIGRDAIAFRATTPTQPHREWLILSSPDTGRFLGLEESTLGDDPTLDVPAGTVVLFQAWH